MRKKPLGLNLLGAALEKNYLDIIIANTSLKNVGITKSLDVF